MQIFWGNTIFPVLCQQARQRKNTLTWDRRHNHTEQILTDLRQDGGVDTGIGLKRTEINLTKKILLLIFTNLDIPEEKGVRWVKLCL